MIYEDSRREGQRGLGQGGPGQGGPGRDSRTSGGPGRGGSGRRDQERGRPGRRRLRAGALVAASALTVGLAASGAAAPVEVSRLIALPLVVPTTT